MIVKVKETLVMMHNVAIPYIEVEGSQKGNLYDFEIVKTEWVLKYIVLRIPVISDSARMTTKYFLKHRLPFQYDPISGNPERISSIKSKTVNYTFGLGFKPKKKDYKRIVDIKQKKS